MRFPHSFKRYVGKGPGGGKELGKDELPASGERIGAAPDNLVVSRLWNVHGYPVQRLVVGFVGPKGAGNLSCVAMIFDDETQHWFCSGTCELYPNALSYIDVPTLLDNAKTGGGAGLQSSGAIEALLLIKSAGKAPEGEYVFVAGTDVSNAP